MDPIETYNLVDRAYKRVRFSGRGHGGSDSRLARVFEQLDRLHGQSDRTFEVLDFKSQNREVFEDGKSEVLVNTIQMKMSRLLGVASMDVTNGLLLYELVRALGPRTCVEIGTCIGVSSMYIAAALHDNGAGKLLCFEGDPALSEVARENLEAVAPGMGEVVTGPFDQTVEKTLAGISRVEFAFSDQEHYLDPTLRDLNALAPKMPAGAALVIDDINYSAEMQQTWDRISEDPRCGVSVTPYRLGRAGRMGIWIRGDDKSAPQRKVAGHFFDRPNPLNKALRALQSAAGRG